MPSPFFFSNPPRTSLTSLLLLVGVVISFFGTGALALPEHYPTRRFAVRDPKHDVSHLPPSRAPLEERAMSATAGESGGFRSVAYFVNWAIYARKHRPQDIPVESLTHVLYAFADVKSDSGTVFMTDSWADTDIHWEGDSWSDSGNNMYGCMKQLNMLKQKNRNLKVLLSIGGWTYSAHFPTMASTPAGRSTFAKSAVQLLKDYGFDGLDVDWEYPASKAQGDDFAALLKATRDELDAYSATLSKPYHFELTVACPAGPTHIANLNIPEMDKSLDFWNLMAYDYAGSWDKTSGHQANWNPSPSNSTATPFSTKAALEMYTSGGVKPSKIVVGMPLYGRAFEGTDAPGKPYTDIGQGNWEKGIYDFKNLPLPGATEQSDDSILASWSYNPATKQMVSYDTLPIVQKKSAMIKSEGYGGSMWWETSGDKTGTGSLIAGAVAAFGGPSALQKRENCITYPESKYDNLKNGFGGGNGGGGGGGSSTTSTTTTQTPTSTGAPGVGIATGAPCGAP